MTTAQKRKILIRIQGLESEIEQMKEARSNLACDAIQSATISSGGGSKSFTKMDISRLTETINELIEELNGLKRLIVGGVASMPRQIVSIYY